MTATAPEPDGQPGDTDEPLADADLDDEPGSPPPTPLPAEPGGDEQPADSEPAPIDVGTPAGQLAAGAALVLVGGGWLLYRAGGWLWVAIGAAALVALAVLAVVAPLIWRRLRGRRPGSGPRSSWPRLGQRRSSTSAFGASRGSRSAAAGRAGGGLRAALGRLMPGGRSRPAGAGGGRTSTAPGDRGKPGPLRRAGRAIAAVARRLTGRSRRESAGREKKSRRSATERGPVRRTAAVIGDRVRRARQAIGRRLKAAGQRIDAATGGRLSRVRERLASASWPRALLARLRQWDERLTGGLAAAVWRWWRSRRRAPGADDTAPSEGDVDTQPFAQSTSHTSPDGTTRVRLEGSSVSEFALVTHATELPTIAAEYESDHMMDVRGHMALLRELPLAAGTSVRIWTERLAADYPLNPDAAEALQRVYDAFGAAVEACDEALVVFEGSHERDIELQLQPRTNEHKWNHR